MIGTASAITSELDALVFTPAAGTPNASATTTFALSDKSSGYATATTNDDTSVNVSTPAVAPTITGAVANQTLTVGSTDTPFSKVTIGDLNANANDTLTITLTGGERSRTGRASAVSFAGRRRLLAQRLGFGDHQRTRGVRLHAGVGNPE